VVGRPTGLSVNDARHVIVTCCDDHEIRKYTATGRLVRVLKLQQVESHVTRAWHAVQLGDSQFVVSQYRPVHGVIRIDEQGRVMATYRNSESVKLLDDPEQLAVTNNGSFVLVDHGNNRLVALNAALRNARVLSLPISGRLNRPSCLYFNESIGRMYVGEYGGKRVLIFDNIRIS